LSARWLWFVLVGVAACGRGGDALLDITYDPCEPVVVEVATDASSDELASVEDALAMWRPNGVARLSSELAGAAGDGDAQRIPLGFEDAAPLFHGIYRDEVGDVVINRRLTDRRARAVTIAHELGHAFGLWHVDRELRVSVMNEANLEVEPTTEDAAALIETWGSCP
jgi:hypothetical protein